MKDIIVKNSMSENLYGLLGKGISHSFSPKLHSYLGDYTYKLFDIDEDEVKEFILSKNYSGLNVTMPYKKLLYSLCDKLSYTAKTTGSVNTIVNENGLLCGYNTDYDGFKSLMISSNVKIDGKKVVILGSGGASSTVKAVVENMGAGCVVVISRTGENNYGNISRHFDADVIINTTPVGMFPDVEGEIVDISKFTKCGNVIDIIYNPLRTRLLLRSKLCGKNIFNGLYMLICQGIESSYLFNGGKSCIDSGKIMKDLINKKRNIVLTGMPGVGKTTLGNSLAKKLGVKFIDTDNIIYNLFGKSCEEIIQSEGEKFFRDLEKKVIKKVSQESGAVIATGGGAVLDEENMLSLMANGVVFFVRRDFNFINKNCGAIIRAGGVDALYKKRKYMYEKYCDFQIYNNKSINDGILKIISKL